MKKEKATVLEIYNNNTALIELIKSEMCGECSFCSKGKPIRVKALNDIKAVKGDNVIVEIEPLKKGTTILVYLIPIICLILGYFIGFFIAKSFNIDGAENYGVLSSLVLFLLYVTIGIIRLRKTNRIAARIVAKDNV